MPKDARQFCWYELMTDDVEAAKAFYGHVVGWSSKVMPGPNGPYTTLSIGGRGVAGMLETPEHARQGGAKPLWLGYVAVSDADETCASVAAAGGSVCRPPQEIPDVGRFAVLSDPQGAILQVLQPLPMEVPPALPPTTPGTIGWHELFTSDGAAAFRFYADQFDWTKAGDVDMGPMGIYQLFAAGAEPIGGIMNAPPEAPTPMWTYYFWVDGIDAAIERVTSGRGRIIHGPVEVMGPVWVVQAIDPEGARFGLVSPHR